MKCVIKLVRVVDGVDEVISSATYRWSDPMTAVDCESCFEEAFSLAKKEWKAWSNDEAEGNEKKERA